MEIVSRMGASVKAVNSTDNCTSLMSVQLYRESLIWLPQIGQILSLERTTRLVQLKEAVINIGNILLN
jgi:hypothetical protein